MGTFDIRGLRRPVVVAPMAGGPSTPELAAAGSNAGGLGFLAAGYLTADGLAEKIDRRTRFDHRTAGRESLRACNPARVRPNRSRPTPRNWPVRRSATAWPWVTRATTTTHGRPSWTWCSTCVPEVVSFTFGLPSEAEIARLRGAGIATVGTVTTLDEARLAVGRGVDALAVQGPAAGGHRGTFDPAAAPASQPLEAVARRGAGRGGRAGRRGGRTGQRRRRGAVCWPPARWPSNSVPRSYWPTKPAAARCTAPLCKALSSPKPLSPGHFPGATPAGCATASSSSTTRQAPLGYPEIHYLTSPVRKASVAAGDPQATNVWAGTGWRQAGPGRWPRSSTGWPRSNGARGPRPGPTLLHDHVAIVGADGDLGGSDVGIRRSRPRRTSVEAPDWACTRYGPRPGSPITTSPLRLTASTRRGAASRKSTVMSPSDVVALNSSVTATGSRETISPSTVWASTRRAAPRRMIDPSETREINWSTSACAITVPSSCSVRTVEAPGLLGRHGDGDLPAASPLQHGEGLPAMVIRVLVLVGGYLQPVRPTVRGVHQTQIRCGVAGFAVGGDADLDGDLRRVDNQRPHRRGQCLVIGDDPDSAHGPGRHAERGYGADHQQHGRGDQDEAECGAATGVQLGRRIDRWGAAMVVTMKVLPGWGVRSRSRGSAAPPARGGSRSRLGRGRIS